MNKKKIYILGGFGTESSLNIANSFFTEYKKGRLLEGDYDCIKFFLDSNPGNTDHMNKEQCEETVIKAIKRIENLQNFEKDYVFYTIICCNTMHQVIDSNEKLISNINLVHLIKTTVEHTVKVLNNEYDRNIILWSTKSTYNSKMYHKRLKQHNLILNKDELVVNYDVTDNIIINIKKRNHKEAVKKAVSVLSNYDSKLLIILGCTELPLIKEKMIEFINKHCLDIVIVDCNLCIVNKLLKLVI